jgi:hypothetical protein
VTTSKPPTVQFMPLIASSSLRSAAREPQKPRAGLHRWHRIASADARKARPSPAVGRTSGRLWQ